MAKKFLFEILNDEKQVVCTITDINVLKAYDESVLKDMYKSGHRFKLNGKSTSLKAATELL